MPRLVTELGFLCYLHGEITGDWDFPCLSAFQVVPHITDAIKNWIEAVAVIPVDGKVGPADVCVIELGGTVGMSYSKQRGIWCAEEYLSVV